MIEVESPSMRRWAQLDEETRKGLWRLALRSYNTTYDVDDADLWVFENFGEME